MDSTEWSTGPQLPPGFRFHPTDEELIVHYLQKKAASAPLPVSIIAEVDLYKFDPWELPSKATFGEGEWYFFSPRDRKYPNGARPNRAATSGYWKATGTDKPVTSAGGAQKVGVKKALVFYEGKPPKGVKTRWIMHEYRLADSKPATSSYLGTQKCGSSSRLDDWVLCRIYKKTITPRPENQDAALRCGSNVLGSFLPSISMARETPRPSIPNERNPFDRMLMSTYVANDVPATQIITSGNPNLLPARQRFVTEIGEGNEDSGRADENGCDSIAGFLCHVPHAPQPSHQEILGLVRDGFFRQAFQYPSSTWYS